MSVVYLGHDLRHERDVAIKVLPTEFSSDEHALGRFLAEAKSAGQLNHAHTVTVPGACAGWCDFIARCGRLEMSDVLAPAIELAEGS